jgi:phage tail-like protein
MSDVKIIGKVRDLYPKHLFQVIIAQGWHAGFSKCSELKADFAEIAYHEGGSIIPWKMPGRMTISDITLERGACSSVEFYNWMRYTGNAAVSAFPRRGAGEPSSALYMKDITINQLRRDGVVQAEWRCYNAWVKSFTAGDWDNGADEAIIEKLTLSIDYFERIS